MLEQTQEDVRFASECLKGNPDAVKLVLDLFEIVQFWDDLIDRDKPVTDADINRCMYAAVIEVPTNPFYLRHQSALIPLMVAAIHNWQAATAFERTGGEEQKQIAFVLRSSYVDILLMCAHIVGGYEWAQSWVPTIRNRIHGEGFEAFKAALKKETEMRNGPV